MTNYNTLSDLPPQYRKEAAEQMAEQTRHPALKAKTIQEVDAQPKPVHAPPLYQKIVLMGERPESWNKLKRMDRWKWQKEVNRCKGLVLAAIPHANRIQQRVKILVTVFFDKRPYDCSNIPLKLFEDGLVKAGLLGDDSIKYVIVTATRSLIDRDRPRVEIEIYGENDRMEL